MAVRGKVSLRGTAASATLRTSSVPKQSSIRGVGIALYLVSTGLSAWPSATKDIIPVTARSESDEAVSLCAGGDCFGPAGLAMTGLCPSPMSGATALWGSY